MTPQRPPAVANLELSIEACPSSLAILRRVAVAFARSLGLDEQSVEAVASAVNEAASNSIVHGYRGEDGLLRMSASLTDGKLAITLADDGIGDQATAREGDEVGRGMPLMRALSDSVEVTRSRRGTQVRLTFPLASDRP